MLQIPIFHVNGEDPEAVAQVVDLALDFRHTFQRDVVIDMYCFRRWGHNEGDEPAFTQPLTYRAIEGHSTVRDGYLDHLLALGELTHQEADEIALRRKAALEEELSLARRDDFVPTRGTLESMWQGYMGHNKCFVEGVATGLEREQLVDYLRRLAVVPDGFQPHRKLQRLIDNRRAMADGKQQLDWATAELAALASVAAEGYRVRFSGQDSQRGTFSQRHAVLHNVAEDRIYHTRKHIHPEQAEVEILNSPLSERAAVERRRAAACRNARVT